MSLLQLSWIGQVSRNPTKIDVTEWGLNTKKTGKCLFALALSEFDKN